jgi:hypothetical protein
MYSYDRRATRPIPVDKAQARKLAQRIVKELPKEFKFHPNDAGYPINRNRGFRPGWVLPVGTYFIPKDVLGKQVEVPVRVKFKELTTWGSRRWVTGGEIDARYYHQGGVADKLAMNLFINSGAVTQQLLDHLGEVEDELFSVIIHEATHLADVLRLEYSGDEDGDGSDYYNAPTELRAFMQQITDEVLREADKLGKLGGAWMLGPTPSGDTVDNLLSKSPTWERIRKHLEADSTKLILRGVTRALQDEWPSLLERYPED